ncbi:hypothetical protein WJX81_008039 [Elliptochloris bilobata]|uniref:RRM domain-containing protein n=1 Tax=Elliptochloris bilobata TaxID=381761 RepID=A0AAW1SEJ0_9CHLO
MTEALEDAPVAAADPEGQEKAINGISERKKSGDNERERARDRDGEKARDKEKERSKERERGKDKERDREKDRDKEKDRKDREREKGKDKDKDKEHERRKSKHRSRSRSRRRDGSRERRRSKHRSHSRGRHSRRRRSPSSSSDDDMGGYVPRKRQEPPRPAGFSTSYVDPYGALRASNPSAAKGDPAEVARAMQEQQLLARQMVLQQQAASAVAAASKTQREVYVGNLVAGLVTEDALRQLFNTTMQAAFPGHLPPGVDAVCSVSMHSEGRYAFVELRTPEMASAALQLSNQVQLLGQQISVGRPSGYVDPSKAQEAAAAAAAALTAFQAGDMAAMEYQLQQAGVALPAISASAPPDPFAPLPLAPAPFEAGAPLAGGDPMVMGAPPAAASPGPQAPVPTAFLQVEGMVTPDVLVDDQEYREVIQDLHDECGKFGSVVAVVIPRPLNPATAAAVFGMGNIGKAFVQFAHAIGCAGAKKAIHGRMFAGATVQANYVSAEAFAAAAGPPPG